MGKDSEDNNEVEIERVAESPNINTDSDDIDGLRDAISSNSQQSDIDKKPTKQEDIKFYSANISRSDGKELMVNVEGSQKRKIDEAKQKKKDQQEAEKRKKTEEHKRKHDAQVIKRNKRISDIKYLLKKIWGLKYIFLIIIVLMVSTVIIFKFVVPNINNRITEVVERQKKESDEKILQKERTDMLKILEKVIGNKYSQKDVETIINDINPNARIYAYDSDGEIDLNGTTEHIKFRIKDNLLFDFNYIDNLDGIDQQIYKSGDKYHYINGEELYQFNSLDDALVKYLTNIALSEER